MVLAAFEALRDGWAVNVGWEVSNSQATAWCFRPPRDLQDFEYQEILDT